MYRLVTNTFIEEEIFNRASFKMGLDKLIIQAGLFNQKSTEQDRTDHLANIIKNNKSQSDLYTDITSPEKLNEYLARSKEELKLF